MNTVLLTTKYNRNEMIQFAKELAARQKVAVTGKLIVTAGSYIDDEAIQEIGLHLKDIYEVVELNKVQLSEDQPEDAQVAVMISTWQMQRYTSAPGPWIVFDAACEIIEDNPISKMERIHKGGGAANTGRANALGGGKVPQGPVVIGAEAKKLRTLRSVSGQNWRNRGRWVFNTNTWYQVPAEEYPFRLVAKIEEPAQSDVSERKTPVEVLGRSNTVVQPNKGLPTVGNPAKKQAKAGVGAAGMQAVAMPVINANDESPPEQFAAEAAESLCGTVEGIYEAKLESEAKGEPVAGDPNYEPPKRDLTDEELAQIPKSLESGGGEIQKREPTGLKPKKLPFVPIEPDCYGDASREALMDQLAHRSGRKPHPATSKTKLIGKLQALDSEG